MNIVSLNVNQFLGTLWREKPDDYENEAKDYWEKTIKYLNTHIQGIDDIIILQEVPYWIKEEGGKKKIFDKFEETIKSNQFKLKLLRPNYLGKRRPRFITCAIVKDGSHWETKGEQDKGKRNKGKPDQDKQDKEELVYECADNFLYNRAIELYNHEKNLHLLGVHIPFDDGRGCIMWNDIIVYYVKMLSLGKDNVMIVGDLNVYAEDNNPRKRKFDLLTKELKRLDARLGAIDAWVAMGKQHERITQQAGARLDYALLSQRVFAQLGDNGINIDDLPRMGDGSTEAFTDHSAIELTFKDESQKEGRP